MSKIIALYSSEFGQTERKSTILVIGISIGTLMEAQHRELQSACSFSGCALTAHF